MTLFGSIQLGANALRAQQIGLQVVGQNISNANTPGYIREEVELKPAPTQRYGGLLLGLGVQVQGVVQRIDTFLVDRLRGAISDRAGAEAQEETYLQIEGLLGELTETDLSTSLNKFFASISEILNQPESLATRNLAVLQGKTLTGDIRQLASRVAQYRVDINQQVGSAAADINRLAEEIRTLNIRIAEVEGSATSSSDAVGLRDQRLVALQKLAELVDIRVDEQPSGGVNVFVAGDYLVLEGVSRKVETVLSTDQGLTIANVQFVDTESPVEARAGRLAGLLAARDDALRGFLDQLDGLSRSLVFEFNRIFSSGQGLSGYRQLTSEHFVADANAPLDAAGLDFTPHSGSFEVQVYNRRTGLTKTTRIEVDLNGLNADTSLSSMAAAIDAIDGVSASVTPQRGLTIVSDDPEQELAFADDTSGVLAALGIGTFFSGATARSIGVRQELIDDPGRFAASRGGIGHDTDIAAELAGFLDRRLETEGGATLNELYSALVSRTTQASTISQSVAEGLRVFEQTLYGQHLAISGVSTDEEIVKMLSYQRAFQATARYITTISDLLNLLVNL